MSTTSSRRTVPPPAAAPQQVELFAQQLATIYVPTEGGVATHNAISSYLSLTKLIELKQMMPEDLAAHFTIPPQSELGDIIIQRLLQAAQRNWR